MNNKKKRFICFLMQSKILIRSKKMITPCRKSIELSDRGHLKVLSPYSETKVIIPQILGQISKNTSRLEILEWCRGQNNGRVTFISTLLITNDSLLVAQARWHIEVQAVSSVQIYLAIATCMCANVPQEQFNISGEPEMWKHKRSSLASALLHSFAVQRTHKIDNLSKTKQQMSL